jgi:arylsulfatase A-like enzyme
MKRYSAAVALLLVSAASGPSRALPPDVLLISIDDLRADRVRPDLMPRLSGLAAEGASYAAAFSQATWTLPSHASLLLSLYPLSHGAGGSVAGDDFRSAAGGDASLADVLSMRGYATADFTNAPYLQTRFSLLRGFQRSVNRVIPADPLTEGFDWFLSTSAPRFLFAHTFAVHNYNHFDDAPKTDDGAWRCPPKVVAGPQRERRGWTVPTCAESRINYDRAAACLDSELGREFDRLRASGRWDSTAIVVVSDHGESLCDGEDERQGHRLLGFEEQARVPWIMKLPGGRGRGVVVGAPVQLIDVAPTLLEALGLPAPKEFEGVSRLANAEGRAEAAAVDVFTEGDEGLSVREAGWRLILGSDGEIILSDVGAAGAAPNTAALRERLREHVGAAHLGWKIAVSGRAGDRTELRLESDQRLAFALPAFLEKGETLTLSPDGKVLTVALTAEDASDDDWVVVEAAEGASLTLTATRNGRPLEARLARLAGSPFPGPMPWNLGGAQTVLRGRTRAVPPRRGGVEVWRSGADAPPRRVEIDERLHQALRAAGYEL